MASLKDLRELMVKANSEYKNNPQENEKYYAFYAVMIIYAITSLSVFIMPKDILERHEILLKFTEFMAGYFPNISVFSNASSLPQVVAFYTALMWIMGAFLFIFSLCMCIAWLNKNIKNKRAFFKEDDGILFKIFSCVIGFFAFYVYYSGYIVTDGIQILAKSFIIDMSSKFEIFVVVNFFQISASFIISLSLFAMASWVHQIIYKIKNKRN